MRLYADTQRTPIFLFVSLIMALVMARFLNQQSFSLAIVAFAIAGIFLLSFFSVALSLQLLIASMLLSPEITVAQTALREVTVRFDDVILTAMTLSWLLRMAILKDIGFVRKNRMNRPVFAYSLVAVLSTGLGVWRGDVRPLSGFFFVLKFVEYFVLYMMVVNYVRDWKTVHRMLTTILVVGGIIVLYGLYQAITGGDVAAPFEGSHGERNTLGGYLVLVGAVGAGVMLFTDRPLERRIIAPILAILTAVLLFSISRSGWLSAIVATVVLFVHFPQKKPFFILVIVVAIGIPILAPEVAKERLFFTFHQTAHPGYQLALGDITLDTSSSARLFSYMTVLRKLLKHPIIGYGVTGFSFIDGQFFRTLIEMGTVGLGVLFWLVWQVHTTTRQAISAGVMRRLHGMAVGFHAGLWGLMAHALTANTFVIVRIAEPFWCLAGLVTICSRLEARSELQQEI